MAGLLMDHVVKFCDEEYRKACPPGRDDREKTCNNCRRKCSYELRKEKEKEKGKPRAWCHECFNEVHGYSTRYPYPRNDYNCKNLCYAYVCKYGFAYCSEMLCALKRYFLTRHTYRYTHYDILSLGCGPGTDLMAFDYYVGTRERPDIKYMGVDKNVLWKTIWQEAADYANSKGMDVKFEFGDVCNFLDSGAVSKTCNVIVLQYLLSMFFYGGVTVDAAHENMEKLFRRLIEKVIKNPERDPESPMLIIIIT